ISAVVLAVGCSGATHRVSPAPLRGGRGAGAESGAWASAAELTWLRKLGAWDLRLMRGLEAASRIETSSSGEGKLLAHDGRTLTRHSQALDAAGNCSADLRAK